MGITPTSGLGASHNRLTQPLGSKGLPLTLVYADAYDDVAPSRLDRYALFDTGLHQPKATGSGTVINTAVSPMVVNASITGTTLRYPTSELSNHQFSPQNAGLTTNLTPPSLNHESGALEFGQIVQDISRSHHRNDEVRSSVPFARLSLSEAGRFTGYERRRYNSGRPANHPWQQTKTTDDDVVGSIDLSFGSYAAKDTFTCSHPTFTQGGRIEAITHYAKADLPSNGLGICWGDAHNATFLTSLGSAPIHESATGIGMEAQEDDLLFSSHWSLNLGVRQPVLASGTSISSPDALPVSVSISEDVASRDLLWGAETMQSVMVMDKFSDGTLAEATDYLPMSVGRVDLGNHVVADSCGLIGYEGVITATAFFSITKNTDPNQVLGQQSITDTDGSYHHAGLNIQVHSGTTWRRNGDPAQQGGLGEGDEYPFPPFLYGSDGQPVDVMTDALKTSAHRNGAFEDSVDANATTFHTRRNVHQMTDSSAQIPLIGGESIEINTEAGIFRQSNGGADRLFGSTAKAGDSWGGAQTLSSGWLSDSIPTKVRIVPQVLGYTDVRVSAGEQKQSAHPEADTIEFRKPIVDYHILVSVADKDLVMKADTSVGVNANSEGTTRNQPTVNRLHADMDLSDVPCTIYHGIVRINPTTLEQIWIDPAEVPNGYDLSAASCPMTVLPRHTSMDVAGKASMGWGLHQITPFRPIASRQWVRVPKVCATIESGGYYQRGGVSHLWDADAYGGELFVSADMIDATDFATQTTKNGKPYFGVWGHGQITTNGSHEPAMPQGSELMVFRYSPNLDPWHPHRKATTATSNPLYDALGTNASAIDGATLYSPTFKTGFTITDESLLADSSWAIHDWVFPQVELMRYLGREQKSSMRHPKHSESDGSEIVLHPTIHCSSLRIMDDGRMMMAMVHRDYIDDVNEFPAADIGYPPNPDLSIGQCPQGYVYSDGKCVPIVSGGEADGGLVFDPASGDQMQGDGDPSPEQSGEDTHPTGDNFSQYPSWNKLIEDTSARSLILAFSDAPANANGQVARGRADFSLKWELVPVGDEETQELAIQSWTNDDTWWSGARISYWYAESGQRAIPITYGSYPECRMSHAVLPKSLPWLDSDLKVRHGMPFRQPATMVAPHPSLPDPLARLSPVDEWYRLRYDFLRYTRFVPTTIGFADFGAGANPHQELGWSGWSFPADLYDPASYGDGSQFFRDSATKSASWEGMGSAGGFSMNAGFSPYAAVVWDLSNATFPADLLSFKVFDVGGETEMVLAPIRCTSVQDLVSQLLSSPDSLYGTVDTNYIPHGGTLASNQAGLVYRLFDDRTTAILPPELFNGTQQAQFRYDIVLDNGQSFSPYIQWSGAGTKTMIGSMASWSYHGALHYGLSSTHHPYRVDRVFKQVHAGLGYDIPLHLLIPPSVHVRARAGGNGQIDLEMETPFHRTDYQHLIGASLFESGFELGGASPAGTAQKPLGQWFLRSNLWDSPISQHGSSANVSGINLFNQRIKGAVISGSIGLEAYWSDHPTDHFHAGAMPILPNNDYDLAMIETNRYAPVMLARASEMHDLDVLATSEQLLSSVDVHVSQSARAYWDSGAIVSAQAIGEWDNIVAPYLQEQTGSQRSQKEVFDAEFPADTHFILQPYIQARGNNANGMGKGQRVIRTPEGTLHNFVIKRSLVSGYFNQPTWTHMKKPLGSDLFWSRRAMQNSPDTQTNNGEDECGKKFTDISTESDFKSRHLVAGAAFASDSKGTIHAVLEYHHNPNNETGTDSHRAHRLYYHKADRVLVASSPEPVYDWDWSVYDPVLINTHLETNDDPHGTLYDFRMPSLVCDSKDRLHLVVNRPYLDIHSSAGVDTSSILYALKEVEDTNFPTPTFDSDGNATGLWQTVGKPLTDRTDTTQNQASSSSHLTTRACWPKVCLRSDDIPVVFWLGEPFFSGGDPTERNHSAVYANIGFVSTGGRIEFNNLLPCHVMGLPPNSKIAFPTNEDKSRINHYDAIIDEKDMAVVVGIRDDRQTSPQTGFATMANRHTIMTRFNTRKTFAEQYTTTDGLGDTRTLLYTPNYNGSTEMRKVDTFLDCPTITTNGKGEYHVVMGFTMTGHDDGRVGAVFRDAGLTVESAVNPLQWAGTPLPSVSGTLYAGGYARATPNAPDWTGRVQTGRTPSYTLGGGAATNAHKHLMHLWFPSYEYDEDISADDRVIRSVNMRWLSVPSLRFDSTKGWQPVGAAQTIAGQEDFTHMAQQLRYQRFWGYDASEIDLTWRTNELSWYATPHHGSRLYYPALGGVNMTPTSGLNVGLGLQGFENGE